MIDRRCMGIAVLFLIVSGCEQSPTDTKVPPQSIQVSSQGDGSLSKLDDAAAQTVAKALGIALADPHRRLKIRDDLRDSPFEEHALHVPSYLLAGRNRELLAGMAAALDVPLDEMRRLILQAGPMRLSLTSALDRMRWTGEGQLDVVAHVGSRTDRIQESSLVGFDSNGTSVQVPVQAARGNPVLSLLPIEHVAFGMNPEATRSAAPSNQRSTVTTKEEERQLLSAGPGCDENALTMQAGGDECDDGGGGGGTVYGPGADLSSNCTSDNYNDTTPTNDKDQDGIKDACEWEIAQAFEPWLIFHTDEWDYEREPYWAVNRDPDTAKLQVIYMLSYYYDAGTHNHYGDSEFIIVRVNPGYPARYNVYEVTLSAHWGAPFGADDTRTLMGSSISYKDVHHPWIFSSKDNHANYDTKSRCESHTGDTCSDAYGWNEQLGGGDFQSGHNVGNAAYPFDIDPQHAGAKECARSRLNPITLPYWECFLTGTTFSGWSGDPDNTTGYQTVLQAFDFY